MIKDFKRADSIEEAVSYSKEGYHFIAGGTQINNGSYKKWGNKVEKLVSIDSLGLDKITRKGKTLTIGSTVCLQDLVDSDLVPPALSEAASFIPTRSVRNIATIGGNIGANRRDSYLIPALMAYRAELVLASGTSVSLDDYVQEDRTDLIMAIEIQLDENRIVKVVKESRSHIALPVVSAAVSILWNKREIHELVIACACIDSKCIRLKEIEKNSGDFSQLEENISAIINPTTDILGTVEYKRYINSVKIADALRACIKEGQS